MKETGRVTILLIDDHCSVLLPALEPLAKSLGCEIITAENGSAGLGLLEKYAGLIDAVVLDLHFGTGGMQGSKILEEIKSRMPYMPVIILTDSDKAVDLSLVVQCMKRGAYNYIGKGDLDPAYLFQVISKAVEERKVRLLLRQRAEEYKGKPICKTFLFENTPEHGETTAMFGFRLACITEPQTDETWEKVLHRAVKWHERFFKVLCAPYHNRLRVNLAYQVTGQKITTHIVFSITSTDPEVLSQKAEYLQDDLRVLFKSRDNDRDVVYQFIAVESDTELKGAGIFAEGYHHTHYNRQPALLRFKETAPIGFRISVKRDTVQEDGDNHLAEFFPLAGMGGISDDLFYRVLSEQPDGTALFIELVPRQYSLEEADMVAEVAADTKLIGQELDLLNGNAAISEVQGRLSEMVSSGNPQMFIRLFLQHRVDIPPQSLITTLKESFFGKEAIVRQETVPSDRYGNSRALWHHSGKGDLSLCYPRQEAMRIFRLPIPQESAVYPVPMEKYSFRYCPANLPLNGITLGRKRDISGDRDISIHPDSLLRHLYVMGQTGTGKSTLLKKMIKDVLNLGRGFTLIDPHGDLFEEVLAMVPKSRRKKVVVINPTDPANSAKFDPLYYDTDFPAGRTLVIDNLLRVFDALYDLRMTGGPMFESYFRNGMQLIMDPQVQIMNGKQDLSHFIKAFHDTDYLRELISDCSDPATTRFFHRSLGTSGDISFANIALYITSKLTKFVDNLFIKPLITSPGEHVQFNEVLAEEKILLVRLDKGLIGSSNVSLLGQMVLNQITLSAMARTGLAQEKRLPYYLFVDEFQNFIAGDIREAFAEVRKYGLGMVMANQTLGQLSREIIEALLGNVGSMVFFRPGINDYEQIRHYIEPDFTRSEVLKLPNFNCIGRLLIDNIPSDPFVFQTIK